MTKLLSRLAGIRNPERFQATQTDILGVLYFGRDTGTGTQTAEQVLSVLAAVYDGELPPKHVLARCFSTLHHSDAISAKPADDPSTGRLGHNYGITPDGILRYEKDFSVPGRLAIYDTMINAGVIESSQ